MGNMFQQSGGFLNIHDCFIEGGSGGGMYLGNKIDDLLSCQENVYIYIYPQKLAHMEPEKWFIGPPI